jgi:TRAP-type mannitol/chloroaromatic compound transport system permease small subunit
MVQIKSFTRGVDNINEWIGEKSSYLILVMIASIIYETFVRYLFNSPTVWVHETSSYIFGVSLMLGGGYTFLRRGHVNVDIVHNRFSPRGKAILDIMSSILLFSFASVLIWKGADFAWNSLRSFETSSTVWAPPIYPIKLSIPIGGALLFLQGLSKLLNDISIAIKGGKAT